MVHATLDAPERWGYVFDKLAAAASFPYQNTEVCFFGHTHVPRLFFKKEVLYFNPGSCGPRRFELPVTIGILTVIKDAAPEAKIVPLLCK